MGVVVVAEVVVADMLASRAGAAGSSLAQAVAACNLVRVAVVVSIPVVAVDTPVVAVGNQVRVVAIQVTRQHSKMELQNKL